MKLLNLLLGVAWLCTATAPFAQQTPNSYPTKPVTMIVAFPPGGGTDIVARKVAQGLTAVWG